MPCHNLFQHMEMELKGEERATLPFIAKVTYVINERGN